MTQERLKEILDNHRKWLNNEDGGARANLRYADLRDADLRYADLRDVDLSGADLRDADLSGANLINADLRDADLRDADLIDSDLRYADLSGANLTGADLSGANLRGANLRGANLRGANLRGANLRDADISGANLIDSDLRDAIGNNKQVKSLQLGKYLTTILVGVKIHISCQNHTIEQWEKFTDKEISDMDDGALEWWREWKEVILKVAKWNK